ncbi:MAG TPA: hypothetical protein V6D26_02125 [Stenomitos sp.]
MNKKLIGLALLLTLATTLGACKSETPEGGASPGGAPAESSPSPS